MPGGLLRRVEATTLLISGWGVVVVVWAGLRLWTLPGPCGDEIDAQGFCGALLEPDHEIAAAASLPARSSCPIEPSDYDDVEDPLQLERCAVTATGLVTRVSRSAAGRISATMETGSGLLRVSIPWEAMSGRPEIWTMARGDTLRCSGMVKAERRGLRLRVEPGYELEVSSRDEVGGPPECAGLVPKGALAGSLGCVEGKVLESVPWRAKGVMLLLGQEGEAGERQGEAVASCVLLTGGVLGKLAVPSPVAGERWRVTGVYAKNGKRLCVKALFAPLVERR